MRQQAESQEEYNFIYMLRYRSDSKIHIAFPQQI